MRIIACSVFAEVQTIAMQVSMQGGEGVFWARSLLGVEYEDVLSGLLREAQSIQDTKHKAQVKVIPNPTNEKCLLQANYGINKIEVFNYLDKNVKPLIIRLDENTFEIKFSNMPCGFYFAKIIGEEDAFVKIVYIKNLLKGSAITLHSPFYFK